MCFNLHGIFCVHLADASAACCKVVAVAAPRVVGHCIGNASGHRVIMDVAQYAQKISYRCDRLTLVAILKQCTYVVQLAYHPHPHHCHEECTPIFPRWGDCPAYVPSLGASCLDSPADTVSAAQFHICGDLYFTSPLSIALPQTYHNIAC